MQSSSRILIVGGGPIGLFLAIALIGRGFDCQVIEGKSDIGPHSKSLGIHPASLNLFDKIGITQKFLIEGLKIPEGVAYINRDSVGTLSLDLCPPPHQYVLSLPQNRTERILETHLRSIKPGAVIRGARVTSIDETVENVTVTYSHNGSEFRLNGAYVIGCDGKESFTRQEADIPFHGDAYPDTFIMGDFSDNTNLGKEAAIFLHKDGLTESFPIPGGMRRWIVSTESYVADPDRSVLEDIASKRTGYSLKGTSNSMLNSFGVQHYLAASFFKGRILLAGDAAHVVSPIGGQGMNLGWLGAWDLANTLADVQRRPADSEQLFQAWEDYHRRRVVKATKRAEWNMKMGRKRKIPLFRNLLIHLILLPPFKRRFANSFTMQDLI